MVDITCLEPYQAAPRTNRDASARNANQFTCPILIKTTTVGDRMTWLIGRTRG